MSSFGNTNSMHSLMDAIHNIHTNDYSVDHEHHFMAEIPQFMRSLIAHLEELCLTQASVNHCHHQLHPFISEFMVMQYTNPKIAIDGFFRQYLRLLSIETNKINKIGEKKLKYLTQTVSKQIFTEIMRMSCDLKLENMHRANSLKVRHKLTNNVSLLVGTVNRFYLREQLHSFKELKKRYYEQVNNEEKFVQNFTRNLERLDWLCVLKKKAKLSKAMGMWRRHSVKAAHEESTNMLQSLKSFSRAMIGSVVGAWERNPRHWSKQLPQHLFAVFHEVLGTHPNIGVDFICSPKFDVGLDSLNYSNPSTFRSNHSNTSAKSIQMCLHNDEIQYDNENHSVMIPLTIDEPIGALIINWQDEFPHIFFHRALKLIQLIKQLLADTIQISNRLVYHTAEYDNNQWQSDLYNLYMNESSCTLQKIEDILNRIGIICLQIYHDKTTPRPCISYGSQSAPPFPENIYQMVWEKLDKSSYFSLERNSHNYQITRLSNSDGFCRYLFAEGDLDDHQTSGRAIFIQCVVPLVLGHLGKIGCSPCSVNVKEKLADNLLTSSRNRASGGQLIEPKALTLSSLMFIKQATTMSQVQDSIYETLKNCFEGKPIFASFFYTLDQSNNNYAYRTPNSTIEKAEIPKAVASEHVCEYLGANETKQWTDFVKILHLNPLFEGASIHLYEKQRSKPMKIISCKIGNKGLLVVGSYEQYAEIKTFELLKTIAAQVNNNEKLFIKTDAIFWASQVHEANFTLNLPNSASTLELVGKSTKIDFVDALQELKKSLSFVDQQLLWKFNTKTNKCLAIPASNTGTGMPNLQHLVEQCLQSHQRIPGAHRTIRRSKKKGIKLQQCLSYVPTFTRQQQLMYAKMVLDKINQSGEVTDPAYSSLNQHLTQHFAFNRDKQQWISIPIKYNKFVYVLVYIFPREQLINHKSVEALANYVSEIFKTILAHRQEASRAAARVGFTSVIAPLLQARKMSKIRECIDKFAANSSLSSKRNKLLSLALASTTANIAYRHLRYSYLKISHKNKQIKQIYIKGCELLINKIIKTMVFAPLVEHSRRASSKRKSAIKIEDCVSKLLLETSYAPRWSLSLCFSRIFQHSDNELITRNDRKNNAVRSIRKLCLNVGYRNKIEFFRKSFEVGKSLQKALSLVVEQFNLIEPKGLKSCLSFLNNRLGLVMTQHYVQAITMQLHYLDQDMSYNQSLQQSSKYSLISNSSFGLYCNSDSICLNLIRPILDQILPSWEVSYRERLLKKTKALADLVNAIARKNMLGLFSRQRAVRNKQNIDELNKMRKQVAKQRQEMYELQYAQSSSFYPAQKQAHRQQIKQLRQNIIYLQNQEQKVGTEMRIKSKTNAAYKMISFMNKKKIQSQLQSRPNQMAETLTDNRADKSQLKSKQILSMTRIWAASVERVMRRAQNREIYEGVWNLALSSLR